MYGESLEILRAVRKSEKFVDLRPVIEIGLYELGPDIWY